MSGAIHTNMEQFPRSVKWKWRKQGAEPKRQAVGSCITNTSMFAKSTTYTGVGGDGGGLILKQLNTPLQQHQSWNGHRVSDSPDNSQWGIALTFSGSSETLQISGTVTTLVFGTAHHFFTWLLWKRWHQDSDDEFNKHLRYKRQNDISKAPPAASSPGLCTGTGLRPSHIRGKRKPSHLIYLKDSG